MSEAIYVFELNVVSEASRPVYTDHLYSSHHVVWVASANDVDEMSAHDVMLK